MMIGFNKITGVCIFVLIGLVAGWGSNEKVRLKDVQVLTLYAGRQTTYNRGGPVPQLKCMGGSAGCRDAPDVVQCKNSGWDGAEVQWECKADMPGHTTFGRVNVNCEGYEYPGDKDILKGSCGLEYYLERSKGKSGHNDRDYSSSRLANLVGIAIILLVIYGFYRSCLHQPQYSPTDDYSRPQPGSGADAGFQSGAPPPPGFRSDYYSGSDSCSGNRRSGADAGGAGFWTGAAGGGLLGYLFGRNTGGGYTQSYGNSGWGSGSGASQYWGSGNRSSRSRSRNGGSGSHTSTGYGGTTVR